MEYFLETSDTIPEGVGFSHFGPIHLTWLIIAAVMIVANCLLYRKLKPEGRVRWNKAVALLIVANELFKHTMLLIGGNFEPDYLPLHLCSINIFLIAIHAWRPSVMLSNFLYTVCIPGAMAALLFPSWTKLPVMNFMHLHSTTIHIMLVMYPLVLAVNGALKPSAKGIPKCLGLLVIMAGVALIANMIFPHSDQCGAARHVCSYGTVPQTQKIRSGNNLNKSRPQGRGYCFYCVVFYYKLKNRCFELKIPVPCDIIILCITIKALQLRVSAHLEFQFRPL